MNESCLPIWTYLLTALGALAIFCLLPRADKSYRSAGGLIGIIALGLALFLLIHNGGIEHGTTLCFYAFATLAIVCSVAVIVQTRAVYSALFFVMVILSTAGMVLLLDAEFLAVALVIVYAGAILVTYLFVIMLAQQEGLSLYDRKSRAPFGACLAGFLLMAALSGAWTPMDHSMVPSTPIAGETLAIGRVVMTNYMVVLQLAGVLLLLAMVGAVAIVRKRFPKDFDASRESASIGEVGRKAAPF